MSVLLDKSLALSILINVDEQSFTLFLLFDFSQLIITPWDWCERKHKIFRNKGWNLLTSNKEQAKNSSKSFKN